ncbi:hypothetical protein [Cryobacterium sp. PAMC25264]|uniref:hypothetical protein n=1 Tax=Cryobacterium sp. PAMC25264 TaxID=2861288 RepID=UPI001C62B7BD|nr:hypothetical protein [Cryobacterium sp. PAMC25264]QYF73012.1 hypothetical protein KY500_14770 [Cryobacterium sp. PAMC25264]
MLAELNRWSVRRWSVVVAVAVFVAGGLLFAASMVSRAPGVGAPWWACVAVAGGSILLGLIVASAVDAPIGAEATVCDLRWPVLGLLGLYLARDAGALAPTLSAEMRPGLALAALAVLGWGLAERMRAERRALAAHRRRDAVLPGGGEAVAVGASGPDGPTDGDTCTTCRPLFPIRTHSSEGPTP